MLNETGAFPKSDRMAFPRPACAGGGSLLRPRHASPSNGGDRPPGNRSAPLDRAEGPGPPPVVLIRSAKTPVHQISGICPSKNFWEDLEIISLILIIFVADPMPTNLSPHSRVLSMHPSPSEHSPLPPTMLSAAQFALPAPGCPSGFEPPGRQCSTARTMAFRYATTSSLARASANGLARTANRR